jgi:AraC-like DNA-binding protein
MTNPLSGIQLIIIVLHFVVAWVILYRRSQESLNPANIYLALYLFFVGLYSLTDYAVLQVRNPYIVALLLTNISPIWYLLGPCIYFYVRNTMIGTSKLTRSDAWHLIPFIIQSVHLFPYWISSFEYKLEMAQQVIEYPNTLFSIPWGWLYPSYLNFFGRPLLGIIYSVASGFYLFRNTDLIKKRSIHQNALFKWFMVFLIGNIFLYTISTLVILQVLNAQIDLRIIISESKIYQFLGIVYVIVGLAPLLFPHILYGNIEKLTTSTLPETHQLENQPMEVQDPQVPKDRLHEIEHLMLEYLVHHKPYTHPDFNINKMAEDLDVPEYQLYYYFRYHKKQKFVDYRTQLRIEHAKTLLSSGAANELTLEAVAKASGYQYRTTFIEHFKKVTGMLPSEYMNRVNPLTDRTENPFPIDSRYDQLL